MFGQFELADSDQVLDHLCEFIRGRVRSDDPVHVLGQPVEPARPDVAETAKHQHIDVVGMIGDKLFGDLGRLRNPPGVDEPVHKASVVVDGRMMLDQPAQQIDGDIVVAHVESEVDVEGDHPAVLGIDLIEEPGELARRTAIARSIQQPRDLDAVPAAQPDGFQSGDVRLHPDRQLLADAADTPQQQNQRLHIVRRGFDPGHQDRDGAIIVAHLYEWSCPCDRGLIQLRPSPVCQSGSLIAHRRTER